VVRFHQRKGGDGNRRDKVTLNNLIHNLPSWASLFTIENLLRPIGKEILGPIGEGILGLISKGSRQGLGA